MVIRENREYFENSPSLKIHSCKMLKSRDSSELQTLIPVKINHLEVGAHKFSQLELWSNFSKSTSERVNFQKSWISCSFSSELLHNYFSWISATIFTTLLFLSVFQLSEHFSVDVFISILLFPLKAFKKKFLISIY